MTAFKSFLKLESLCPVTRTTVQKKATKNLNRVICNTPSSRAKVNIFLLLWDQLYVPIPFNHSLWFK